MYWNTISETLNVDNLEFLANKIYDVLKDKTYSFVCSYEYRGYEPEIKINQKLKNGTDGKSLSVWFGESKEYGGFNFVDSYGVWGVSAGKNEGYDPTYKNPYVRIGNDEILITHRTGTNQIAHWLIKVEK